MEIVNGYEALDLARDITKAGQTFNMSLFKYSRKQKKASSVLTNYTGCRWRAQMPHDKIGIDGNNLFLFEAEGEPKTCYKNLIRYIGFPSDNYKLKKVIWYD